MQTVSVERRPISWIKVHRQDLGLAFLLLVISIWVFLLAAPLDPDLHHDGYQFTVALAMSEGLAPHTEVFSQYGPITGLLHSFTLTLLDPVVLSLRQLTAVMLGGVAATGFVLSRMIGVGRGPSFLVAGLWVALAPPWGVFADALPLWPWPSVVFTLAAQVGILTLLIASRTPHSGWLWALAGLVLALSATIRVNQGLPLILAIFSALVIRRDSRIILRANLGKFFGGILAGSITFLAYLLIVTSPSAYVGDAIVGATSTYLIEGLDETARVVAPVSPLDIILFSFVIGSIPLVVVATSLRLLLRKSVVSSRLIVLGSVVGSGVLLLSASIGYYGRARDMFGSDIRSLIGLDGINSLGSAPLYASWLGVFALVVYFVYRWSRDRVWKLELAPTLVLFSTLAFTIQVVPRWDIYHLWWSGPLMLVICVFALTRGITRSKALVLVSVLTIPYVVPAAYSAWNHLSLPRETIESGSLSGMRASSDRVAMGAEISDALMLLPSRSTRFLCDDALIAAFNGRYLADSPNYVQWGWSSETESTESPLFYVTCTDSPEDGFRAAREIGDGYVLMRGPLSMNLSPWSQTELRVYAREQQ